MSSNVSERCEAETGVAASQRTRPRIGRARLPPVERAKLRPLLDEGGVQLRARFQHHRSADYASTRSLCHASQDKGGSCDELFADPWGSTLSDGALRATDLEPLAPTLGKNGARARLRALLKKLSPRGLRRWRSQPSAAAAAAGDGLGPCPCPPWLHVEHQDSARMAQDGGDRDGSIALAVRDAQCRKEEFQRTLQTKISSSASSIFGSKMILSRSLFISPSKPLLKPKPALFHGRRASEARGGGAEAAGRRGGSGDGADRRVASPPGRRGREDLDAMDAGHFPGTGKSLLQEKKINGENDIHNDQNLETAVTLCNISEIVAPPEKLTSNIESPEYVRRAVRRFEDQEQETGDTEFSSLQTVKKPSYLGISCSLSGYSSLTSYDSKVRESFRSRDKSPAPPPPRLLSSMSNKESLNGIGSACKINQQMPTSSPSPPAGSQSPLRSQLGTQQNLNQSPGRYNQGILNSSFVKHSILMDETDRAASIGRSELSKNNSPLNSSLPSVNVPMHLKQSPGAVRVTEFTCQTKSFIQTQISSGEIQQIHSTLESSVVPLNGVHTELHPDVSANAVLEGNKLQTCQPKSFVQQRIERLYGPGALGQGFLSRVRKNSLTPDESPDQVSPVPCLPQLPVLRHLRPEFRAQLPLTSSPLSKSSRCLDISSSRLPTALVADSPKSRSIDVTDFQHAAPDVPVMKAEASPFPSVDRSVNFRPVAGPVEMHTTDMLEKEAESVASEALSENDSCSVPEQRNGHHFLRVLHKEIERLNDLANRAEEELSSTEGLSDDIQGKLRSASGQARLLVKQKLQQFEGLCIKNISQYPGEPFPTTAQDLEGFWDMVKLQIDRVDFMFLEIETLRKNNWKEPPESTSNSGSVNGSRRRQAPRHNAMKPGNGSNSRAAAPCGGSRSKVLQQLPSDKKKTDSARRSREEQALARKQMMEERRQALKAQQAKTEQHVEIYVASRNGK